MKVRITRTDQSYGAWVGLSTSRAAFVPGRIEFMVDGLDWLVDGVLAIPEPPPEAEQESGEAFAPFAGPDPDGPPFELVELRLRAKPGGRGVTPGIIRGVKLGQAVRDVITAASTPYKAQGGYLMAEPAVSRSGVAQASLVRRGRSPSVTDIQKAVDAYRAAVKEGRSDRLKAVAEALYCSVATASRRLQRARDLGLMGVDE